MESERENSELAHAILVTNVKMSEDEVEIEQHVHCTLYLYMNMYMDVNYSPVSGFYIGEGRYIARYSHARTIK